MSAMTTITVRPAVPADAQAIHQLNVAFNDARATPEYIAESITLRAHTERLFVAELAGEMVGMAALRLLPCALDLKPYAELTELYVAERVRQRGAGQALMRRRRWRLMVKATIAPPWSIPGDL